MEQPSFLLKLDDLDINYFLKEDYLQNEILPLWDLKRRPSEYQEFQIVVGRRPEDVGKNTENTITNYKKYKCTLCNLDVPMMYAKEHNSSDKHQINVDFAKAVLERLNNFLSLSNADIPDKIENAFFCEPCATVVMNDNKVDHEQSDSHKKSVLHDHILSGFHKVYKNNTCVNEIFDHMNLSNDKPKDVCTDKNSSVVEETELDLVPTVEAKVEKCDLKIDSESEITHMRNYCETLKASVDSYKFTLTSFDCIEIETVDKCKLKVSFHEFNGLVMNYGVEKIIQCNICMTVVEEEKYEHIRSSRHLKYVTIPLRNYHCYRQVDEGYYHCVLCNDNFFDIESHIVSDPHLKALAEKLIVPKPVQPEVKKEISNNVGTASIQTIGGKTFCKPCNLYFHVNNFASHVAGKKHAANVDMMNNKNQADTREINAEVTVTENQKTNEAKTQTNGIDDNTNTKYTVETATDNAEGNKTLEKLELHRHYQVIDKTVYCRICNTKIPNTNQNLSDHINGGRHTNNYNTILKENQISLTNKKSLHCGFCKNYFSVKKDIDHITSERHKTAKDVQRKVNEVSNKTPNENGHTTVTKQMNEEENKSVLNVDRIHHHFQEIDDKTVHCHVCNTKFPNTVHNCCEHLNGLRHLNNYKTLSTKNGITNGETNFYCDFCKTEDDLKNVLDHIASEGHKLAMGVSRIMELIDSATAQLRVAGVSNNTPETKKYTNETGGATEGTSSDTAITKHMNTEENSVLNEDKIHHHYQVIDDNRLHCQICDTYIPNTEKHRSDHLNGGRHTNNYNNILADNEITLTEYKNKKRFHCGFCKTYFSPKKEIHHLVSMQHKMALNESTTDSDDYRECDSEDEICP